MGRTIATLRDLGRTSVSAAAALLMSSPNQEQRQSISRYLDAESLRNAIRFTPRFARDSRKSQPITARQTRAIKVLCPEETETCQEMAQENDAGMPAPCAIHISRAACDCRTQCRLTYKTARGPNKLNGVYRFCYRSDMPEGKG